MLDKIESLDGRQGMRGWMVLNGLGVGWSAREEFPAHGRGRISIPYHMYAEMRWEGRQEFAPHKFDLRNWSSIDFCQRSSLNHLSLLPSTTPSPLAI